MSAGHSMRALVVREVNGDFIETRVPRPVAAAGEVLVRIEASSVNPLDLKIRAGAAAHARHPFPAVLGMDLAGIVEATGPGVTAFSVGDEVYGLTGGVAGVQGSLAEFAAVDAYLLALKPGNLSMREAAALPSTRIGWSRPAGRKGKSLSTFAARRSVRQDSGSVGLQTAPRCR